MANRLEIEYPWMVFLPVVNSYILGKIIGDKINVFGQELENASIVLVISTLAYGTASQIKYIGIIFTIAYLIINYSAYYKVYRIFKPESASTYIVLSILFPIVQPFLFFSIRNNEPNMTVYEE